MILVCKINGFNNKCLYIPERGLQKEGNVACLHHAADSCPSILLASYSNIVPSPHIWMDGEWSDAGESERKQNARKTKDKTGGCVQMIINTIGHMARDRRD